MARTIDQVLADRLGGKHASGMLAPLNEADSPEALQQLVPTVGPELARRLLPARHVMHTDAVPSLQRAVDSAALGPADTATMVRSLAPNAVEIYRGVGSGVFDCVYRVGDRIVVLEEKGGTSTRGDREAGDLRAEQMTPIYVASVALEMIQRGSANAASTDLATRQAGEFMRDNGQRVFDALTIGTLELYMTQTGWLKTAAGDVPGPTILVPATYSPRAANSVARTIIVRKVGAGPAGSLDAVTFSPGGNSRVVVSGDGVASSVTQGSMKDLVSGIERAAATGAKLVVLPERAITVSRTDANSSLGDVAKDASLQPVVDAARMTGVTVVLGVDYVGPDGRRVAGVMSVDAAGKVQYSCEDAALGTHATLTLDAGAL